MQSTSETMQQRMADMSGPASFFDTAGAILLILWVITMWAAVAALAYGNRGPVRPWVYRTSVGVIVVGVVGQLGHFQEHVLQVAYWLGHPNEPAWMTPLGNGLSRGLTLDDSKPSLGMEILHFSGNLIFLAGLVGIALITRRAMHTKARKWARMGVLMQGIHGLEHLVLTASVALGASKAVGLSTWFGLIDAGPGLWSFRIWWHFIANVVGTTILAIALYHLWRERHEVKAGYEIDAVDAVDAPRGSGGPAPSAAEAAAEEEPTGETGRTAPVAAGSPPSGAAGS